MTSESDDSAKPLSLPEGALHPEKAVAGVYNMWTRPPAGKVLIIGSDLDITRKLEVRLAREGHDIIVTEGREAALEATQREAVDVIITDQDLGDGSGLELLAELKEKSKPFEGLILSHDTSEGFAIKALEAGALAYLPKPIENLQLVSLKVQSAVSKARAERDRDDLVRLLYAQTQDLVNRETEAELGGPIIDTDDIDIDTIAGTDPLTGLPNRKTAYQRFRRETARALRYDRPLCVALASIDGLEDVIERFGRATADGTLRGIAGVFSGMVRDVDFVARKQGGEFLFIFPETQKQDGAVVMNRIREALSQTAFSEIEAQEEGNKFRLTTSVGVAGMPADTTNSTVLRDAVENALSKAKGEGNKVLCFSGKKEE